MFFLNRTTPFNRPLISIIIPVYNSSKYLDRCILSVLDQDYSELEIIIIDDGSTDSSPSICDSFSKQDSRVKVFHICNSGVSNARNFGLKKATGEYVSFIDSDDYVSPDLIRVLYENLIKFNASISTCRGISFSGDSVGIIDYPNNISIIKPNDYNYFKDYAHDVVWGALFDHRIISNLRFESNIKVGEDTLFFAQAILNANLIVDVNAPLYYYFIQNSSLRHKPFDYDRFTDVLARDRIIGLFLNNSSTSQLSCYGMRALVALRCFRENIRDNGWKDSLNQLIINYIRKDFIKTIISGMPLRSKLSVIVASIMPRIYIILYNLFKDN